MPGDKPGHDVGVARDPGLDRVGIARAVDEEGARLEFVGVAPIREQRTLADERVKVLDVRDPDRVAIFRAVVVGVVNGEEAHTVIQHPTRRKRLGLEQMFEWFAARTMVP